MIEVDVGDHSDAEIQSVRRVKAAAKPDLANQPVRPRCEICNGHRGEHLELGRTAHLLGDLIKGWNQALKRVGEVALADGPAVHLDAFGVRDEMRFRHETDVVPGCPQDGGQARAGRALAIGAGDQNPFHVLIRGAEPIEDGSRPFGAELHREAALLRDVVERLLVRQGLRRSSASYVFLINMARVIGPTPPGLGESQPATSATPGPKSPTCLPSTQLVLTSTTAAPGLTMSLLMRFARPAAPTKMSASRV